MKNGSKRCRETLVKNRSKIAVRTVAHIEADFRQEPVVSCGSILQHPSHASPNQLAYITYKAINRATWNVTGTLLPLHNGKRNQSFTGNRVHNREHYKRQEGRQRQTACGGNGRDPAIAFHLKQHGHIPRALREREK